MDKLFVLNPDRTRCWAGHVRTHGQAHKAYLVVDPEEVAAKCREAGLVTRLLKIGREDIPRFGLEVRRPSPVDAPYSPTAKALFDHTGRCANAIATGAFRFACANEFTGEAYRLHHCGADNRRFAEDPVGIFNRVLDLAKALPDRIEYSDARDADPPWRWLFQNHPNLALATLRAQVGSVNDPKHKRRYGRPGNGWTLLQALSRTRKPGCAKFARYLLTEGYEAWCRGEAPALDSIQTWRPTLALLN